MDKTLQNGQFVIGTRLQKDLSRGNIITAEAEMNGKEIVVIKRIIGLPGETVTIKDNIVRIDGKVLEEEYLPESMDTPDLTITLKANEYFCMGDNRNHSTDCRAFGPISYENILYKIIYY